MSFLTPQIAATVVVLAPESVDVCLPPSYITFLHRTLTTGAGDLWVHIRGRPPRSFSSAGPLTGDAKSTEARSAPDGRMRIANRQGVLYAESSFSRCTVDIAHPAAGGPPVFTGRPWLMLALWGYLSYRNGALMHGAVAHVAGRQVMLLGDKGAGKSTLSELVVQAGCGCLSDEHSFLTNTAGVAWAHGTPWSWVGNPDMPKSAPASAIFFLRHAPRNEVRRLSVAEAGERLLRNCRLFPYDPSTIPKTIDVLDAAARTVPIFDFGFVPTLEAVKVLEDVLEGLPAPEAESET